jgi:hypothetical protein
MRWRSAAVLLVAVLIAVGFLNVMVRLSAAKRHGDDEAFRHVTILKQLPEETTRVAEKQKKVVSAAQEERRETKEQTVSEKTKETSRALSTEVTKASTTETSVVTKAAASPGDAVIDALVKLGWNEEMFRPSTSCPRFLHVIPSTAGLGHRFMAVVIAVIRANATRSTLVLGNKVWEELVTYPGHAPSHYAWFGALSGLSAAPFVTDYPAELKSRLEIRTVPHATTSLFDQWDRKCYSALSEHQHWCRTTWCSEHERAGWSLTHSFFSTIYAKLGQHAEKRDAKSYRIAWHVRTGDDNRTPLTSAALLTAMKQINAVLPASGGKTVMHIVYSWDNLCGKYYCDFVHEGEKMQPPVQFLHGLDVPDLMRRLVDADAIVGSGSSLAFVATALTPTSQVVISFPVKEYDNGRNPHVPDFYNRGDYVYLSYDGKMSDVDAARLKKHFESSIAQ